MLLGCKGTSRSYFELFSRLYKAPTRRLLGLGDDKMEARLRPRIRNSSLILVELISATMCGKNVGYTL